VLTLSGCGVRRRDSTSHLGDHEQVVPCSRGATSNRLKGPCSQHHEEVHMPCTLVILLFTS
jgi:hypothetical protein